MCGIVGAAAERNIVPVLIEGLQRLEYRGYDSCGVAVVSMREPHRVVGARAGNPLVIGVGKNENFIASDALALAGTTDRIAYLEEGDVAEIDLAGFRVFDAGDREVRRTVKTVPTAGVAAELGPYQHFMQKEIFEQPRAVADTLEGIEGVSPALFQDSKAKVLGGVDSVLILACGTSFYSGLTAKYWIESLARLPVQVEVASEYRYRDSVPNPKTLIVVVSQSGETADTLAALKHARSLGQRRNLAICNVATSALMRETRLKFLTHAGVEIGVASTKAFPTQLVALFLLALTLAKLGKKLPRKH